MIYKRRRRSKSHWKTMVMCHNQMHIERVREALFDDDIEDVFFLTPHVPIAGMRCDKVIAFSPPAHISRSEYLRISEYVSDVLVTRLMPGGRLHWV